MLLLAASCSSRLDQTIPTSSPPTTVAASPGQASGAPKANGPAPTSPPANATLPRQGTTASASSITDFGPVGTNAFNYLNARVPKLVVEVDAVEGFEPAGNATDLLRTRLSSVVDKPGGIEFTSTGKIPCCHDTWTADQLHTAGAATLDHHSSSAQMVMHVLYVDGRLANAENAIGVAFESSTVAVFKERIEEVATPLVTSSKIESIVVVHETGHLLALVNIGYTSPRDHEDPDCPGHSKDDRSVMTCAVDSVGLVELLKGNTSPPDDYDADDRADLSDIKSGKLG